MERIGAWLWREHQRRFVVLVLGTSSLFVSMTVLTPAIVVGSLFLDLRRTEGLIWFWTLFLTIGCTYAPLLRLVRRKVEPIWTWTRGDHRDPAAAWAALLRLPQIVAVQAMSVVLPLLVVTNLPLVLAMADADWQAILALVIAYVTVTVTSTLLISHASLVMLQPAIADLATRVGSVTATDRGGWTIGGRLLLISFTMASLSGAAMPAAVLGTSANSNDYLVALGGGALWAGYISWIVHVGLLRPTLRPLADVVDATVRVRRGDVHTPVPVTSSDELGELATAFNEMQQGLAEREALQSAFGSYVDPALAQRLIDSGSSIFDGEDLVVSVLFADVRDFTSYSEGVEPAEAVALLNSLFDVAVPVLHEHGGHANHYLGDGLLAVFGAPQPLEHHADAAVAAAVEIQRRVRDEFGRELRLGIGINSGPVIAGTVGGGGRHEFTVIGDTVNVAARVEQLTKDTGDAILITEATRAALSPPRPRSAKRGEFTVRGKAAKVTLHAVNPFPRSARAIALGRSARLS